MAHWEAMFGAGAQVFLAQAAQGMAAVSLGAVLLLTAAWALAGLVHPAR